MFVQIQSKHKNQTEAIVGAKAWARAASTGSPVGGSQQRVKRRESTTAA